MLVLIGDIEKLRERVNGNLMNSKKITICNGRKKREDKKMFDIT